MQTHHILVKGKVQGVFFRATAKEEAVAMGLVGWVKNTNEGDVEMVVSGSEDKLSEFEQWCQSGPPLATVENVKITVVTNEHFENFKILK